VPEFIFVCGRGHLTTRWFPTASRRVRVTKCASRACGRRATYSLVQTHRATQVIPDLTPHFNISLDEPVRSRRHLRELQERYGCEDYEPSPKAREWLEQGREKILSGRR